jgi:hypothetical protein
MEVAASITFSRSATEVAGLTSATREHGEMSHGRAEALEIERQGEGSLFEGVPTDRMLNPRPRSRKSAVRGFGPLQPFHQPCESAGMTSAGSIWPPSTHRNFLACLGWRHYAPSGVTNIPVLGDAELIVGLSARSDPSQSLGTLTTEHMGAIDSRGVRELVEEVRFRAAIALAARW